MKNQLQKFYVCILISCALSACGGKTESIKKNYASLPGLNSTDVEPTNFSVIQDSTDSIHIQSDDSSLDQLDLKKDKSGCYVRSEVGEFKEIHVCATEAVVSLSAIKNSKAVHAILVRKPEPDSSSGNIELEEPRAYSFEELASKGRKLNFDLRAEFGRLKGAKANMRLHYLNLLPHISMNSGLTVALCNPIGWLSAVGDLVPFLLPSRWEQASEASHLYKAEKAGVTVLQENAVQMIEGLVMQVSSDYENLQAVQKVRILNEATVQKINNLESSGKLAMGRHRDVAATVNVLSELEVSLQQSYGSDLIELAYATGFVNPLAISGVQFKPSMDIGKPADYKFDSSVGKKVLNTASELLQMDEMILAAKASAKERMFEWLDPAGDPQAGIGLGLPSYIKIGKSAVETLVSQKAQVSAELLKKIAYAINDYNTALSSTHLALAGIDLHQERLRAAHEELTKNPNDTVIGELEDAYSQLATQMMSGSSNKFKAYNSLSRINRFLHQGIYENKP